LLALLLLSEINLLLLNLLSSENVAHVIFIFVRLLLRCCALVEPSDVEDGDFLVFEGSFDLKFADLSEKLQTNVTIHGGYVSKLWQVNRQSNSPKGSHGRTGTIVVGHIGCYADVMG
jgi:hypothetical protein